MLKPLILKNGITVIRIPKTGSNTFLCGYVNMSGSSNEQDIFPSGISYIVERLFRYGTDKHPSSKNLTTALEGIGAEFYSQTNQDYSQFFITVPSYHQHKSVSILAEIIQHSYFDTRDIEQEKYQIVEQIKTFTNPSESIASNLALTNLYANHSLGQPVYGTIESIMSVTKAEIDNFLYHQYHSNRSYIVLAGNFDSKKIMELVDQEWGYWNPKNRKFSEQQEINREIIGDLPRIQYRQRGLPETEIAIAFILDEGLKPYIEMEVDEDIENLTPEQIQELKGRKLTDLAELLVLNTILGQGYSSRLWAKGVEDEMYFSQVQSDVVMFRNSGYFQILGRTENSQFTFGLECIFGCIESLKQTTVSINELAKAKEYLKGKLIRQDEDLLGGTMWQVQQLIGSSLIYEVKDLMDKISKVEANVIRARALDVFIAERMTITTLGTAKETRIVEKLIQKYLS